MTPSRAGLLADENAALRRRLRALLARCRRAERLSLVDGTTGLPNARHVLVELERDVLRAERSRGPMSLLFIDVDRFKAINDAQGHLAGSRLLRDLGEVLVSGVRRVDMGGRYGGDEFLVLLAGTGPRGALRVAERLRGLVRAHLRSPLTITIGVASHPLDGVDARALLGAADRAMYRAKALGGDRVCLAMTSLQCPTRTRRDTTAPARRMPAMGRPAST
jgi:diguanylate cyclase (GGDEF)-like protein